MPDKIKYTIISQLLYVALWSLASCSGPEGSPGSCPTRDTITIKDYNLIIAPDLSNRISFDVHPKPLHDTVLINGIINEIHNILTLQNRRVGQKDVFTLDFINPGMLNNNWVAVDSCKIDFSGFPDLYTSAEYKRNGLSKDQQAFKQQVGKLYEHAISNLSGADIWNYFNETVRNQVKVVEPVIRREGEMAVSRQLRNVVVLFTDGYIETVNKNKGFRLTDTMIDKIRKDFNASGSTNLDEYISTQSSYSIAQTTKPLKDLDIIIFEMVDRSLTPNGVATKHPTDFEIMSIIWKNWLKGSGCKHVELYKAVADKKLMTERLKNFLKVI